MKQLGHILQLCLFLTSLAVSEAHAQEVLLIWDDPDDSVSSHPPPVSELNPNTQSLIGAITAAGYNVTLSNRPQGLYNGQDPPLADFQSVIHLNGGEDVFDVLPPSTVVRLLNYVQTNGGGYIGGENTQLQIELPLGVGLSPAMNDLALIDRSGGDPTQTITLTKILENSDHPMLTGIGESIIFRSSRMTGGVLKSYALGPQPIALMTDELGGVALAVREFGAGRVVSMHHGGNFDDAPTLSDEDVHQLYINALRWTDQRAPSAVSVERTGPSTTGGGNVGYEITFSEPVDGVSQEDFAATTTGDLAFTGIAVTEVSPTVWTAAVTGLSGSGTIALRLVDNDTIVDRSFNDNPLAGAGTDGGLTGPSYTVDASAPRLVGVVTPTPILSLGSRPTLSLLFSEIMDTTVLPRVVLQTAGNGNIALRASNDFGDAFRQRITGGLRALYTFQERTGAVVKDVSGVGPALNLTIADPANTTWIDGGLRINSATILQTGGNATKIIDSLKQTNAMTMEAWVRPATLSQTGPARIVSISDGTSSRNATLGQDASAYQMRLRTTATDANGIPALTTETNIVTANLQHVVYTRDAAGATRLYVDGAVRATGTTGGDFSSWSNFRLQLGNEFTLNRPWLGEIYLAAVYSRALTQAEVTQNRSAGPITDRLGDGRWVNPVTYQVSLDRAIVASDTGLATVVASGAKDTVENVMLASDELTVSIIASSLEVESNMPPFLLVAAGQTVVFEAEATGAAGTVSYEWMKGATPGSFVPVGGNTPELVLANVAVEDSGYYKCAVSDAAATVETAIGQLVVAAELPVGGCGALALMALVIAGAGAAGRKRG